MSSLLPTISVVIPSHNRHQSLRRLLDKLGTQTFAAEKMQVIVAADGCTDATHSMLQNYAAPFLLHHIELAGEGAAAARNKGAALAKGPLLLFLDDDIDPSENLIEAHVEAHQNENTVALGYLPFAVPPKAGFYQLSLRSWWEQKFQQMQNLRYRYCYEDLLSGNFSVSTQLFKKVQGFDTQLQCREDYELGLRLLQSGADFVFCKNAWGYHRDEATNLHRSLKRKREEGKADVQLWHKHPGLTTALQSASQKGVYTFLQSKTTLFTVYFPGLTDLAAFCLEKTMPVLEAMRLRREWNTLNYNLHNYWYLRGLLTALGSRKKLNEYLHYRSGKTQTDEIEIDLKDGLKAAEEKLNRYRPAGVRLVFGKQPIGNIPANPGAERLKGVHLRSILAADFSAPLTKAIALEKLTQLHSEHTKHNRNDH